MPTRNKSMFPLLGARITVRKKGGADRFVFGLLILLGLLVVLTVFSAIGPFPPWANFMVGAPIVGAASAFAAGILFQVVEFYEHAAVERVFSRQRVFRYTEVR